MSKKLYKSNNRMICGVCGGIAEFFNMDPTIVRLIFVVAVALWGSSLIAYIIAAIIMPERSLDNGWNVRNANDGNNGPTSNTSNGSNNNSSNGGTSDSEFNSYFKK